MRVLNTSHQKVERVAFSADGAHLFASGQRPASLGSGEVDRGLDAFDLTDGTEPAAQLLSDREIHWFATLPNRRLAVAHRRSVYDTFLGSKQLALTRWSPGSEITTPVQVALVDHPYAVSRDGQYAVAGVLGAHGRNCWGNGDFDQEFRRWTLPAGDGISTDYHITDWYLKLGCDCRIFASAFAPDAISVWTAERVRVKTPRRTRLELVSRDTKTGQAGKPVAYPNQNITDLAVSGSFLVAHDGPSLFVYNLASLEDKPKKLTNPVKRKQFGGFAFHPSGNWLAAAGFDGAITVWETATWKVSRSWVWNAGQTRCVAFSPDGTLAAVGTDTGKVVVWDFDF